MKANNCTVEIVKDTPLCGVCQAPMHLLTQLYAPLEGLDRTLYIFACNRASCFRSIFETDENNINFCLGGGTVVRCIRDQVKHQTGVNKKSPIVHCKPKSLPSPSSLGNNKSSSDHPANKDDGLWGSDCDSDDDWGVENNINHNDGIKSSTSIDLVEQMLSKLEMRKKVETHISIQKPLKKFSTHNRIAKNKVIDFLKPKVASFPRFELDTYEEPFLNATNEEDDDDNIGLSDTCDDDVQRMLNRYLKNEEDSDILSAIENQISGTDISNDSIDVEEKYERLRPEDRLMLTFIDRVKRAPKQVIRYAYGGIPLWSL